MSKIIDSPFTASIKREGFTFTETDYISYYEKESIGKDFDPEHPDEFTIVKEFVEYDRVPIKESINAHASKVGLKNLLKGIVSKKQMDDLISKTAAVGGFFDATKLPDSQLEMEKLAGSIDSIWEKIPAELKGDLTKEEFLKTMSSEKLRRYILDEVARQEAANDKKEGE